MAMSRACIFCGSQEEITREHLFPDWLANHLGRKTICAVVTRDSTDKTLNHFRIKLFQQKLKRVCSVCNSGWMSSLEASVQPILASMVNSDTTQELGQEEQALLSFWAAKTIFVLNYNNPSPQHHIIPKAHMREYAPRMDGAAQ